jgi:hypothetical protein
MKFDHLNLPVGDLDRSRDWWVSTLGLKVEFEIAERRAVALQDGEGFAIFLEERRGAVSAQGIPCGSRSAMSMRSSPSGRRAASPSSTGRQRRSGATAPSWPIRTAISCGCGTNER